MRVGPSRCFARARPVRAGRRGMCTRATRRRTRAPWPHGDRGTHLSLLSSGHLDLGYAELTVAEMNT